jgi:hypothetical protein
MTAASIPAAHLSALAPVRDRTGVRVAVADGLAWVTWPVGVGAVVRCLRPVPGVRFYERREGTWYAAGRRLPAYKPHAADAPDSPVSAVLFPARFDPVRPGDTQLSPTPLRLVRGGRPQPTTAIHAPLDVVTAWANTATTFALAAVRGAVSDNRVVLLGTLPTLPDTVRLWGESVLVPLGFRVEPDLPSELVRAAVGATTDEIVLFDETGVDRIPTSAFTPLTRAGIRLAAGGRA